MHRSSNEGATLRGDALINLLISLDGSFQMKTLRHEGEIFPVS